MDFLLLLDDDISGTITDNIGITDKLVPNLWAFLTQLLAFTVMCVAVIFLAYKPIHRYLQKRQDYIANNLADSEKNKREAALANAEAKKNLNASKKEGEKILDEVKKQADIDKAKYEEDLQKELALKREQAKKDIELEKQKAIRDTQDQIVDIALEASGALLKREVNTEDNRKYVRDFVNGMNEDSKDSTGAE